MHNIQNLKNFKKGKYLLTLQQAHDRICLLSFQQGE